MSGKLYVVGTPIGNLGDLSPRAVETLRMVDFIAAEDTRVTLKLLNHLGLKKPMVSYYEHNLRERGELILSRIQAGEHCAVVTDAGMPCISDPGEDLVRLCAAAGVEVAVVPGPSAAIAALALSGLSTSRFSFEGFLAVKRPSRMAHLEQIREERRTLIFYEAPHKLLGTLQDLLGVLGDRRMAACRELTKLHEEVWRGSLSQAVEHFSKAPPRGEFVLVIEGAPKPEPNRPDFDTAVEWVRQRVAQGEACSAAARAVAAQTGYQKNALYRAAQESQR